ncbi:MAG: hypothetical protein ACI8P0_003689, partial [Planctomycetaceae bacterium]
FPPLATLLEIVNSNVELPDSELIFGSSTFPGIATLLKESGDPPSGS